jgi:hypothetical protein
MMDILGGEEQGQMHGGTILFQSPTQKTRQTDPKDFGSGSRSSPKRGHSRSRPTARTARNCHRRPNRRSRWPRSSADRRRTGCWPRRQGDPLRQVIAQFEVGHPFGTERAVAWRDVAGLGIGAIAGEAQQGMGGAARPVAAEHDLVVGRATTRSRWACRPNRVTLSEASCAGWRPRAGWRSCCSCRPRSGGRCPACPRKV